MKKFNYNYNEVLVNLVLILMYINSNEIVKNRILNFLLGFVCFLPQFFVNITNFFLSIIKKLRCLFNFIPLIFQMTFFFTYLFYYVWTAFLLYTYFTFLLISLPVYVYDSFVLKKHVLKIKVYQLKIATIFLCYILNTSRIVAFSMICLIIIFEYYIFFEIQR